MSDFNYPMWIEVVFWSIPLLIYMWILGMWANAKDNQPEEEKEEMTFIRALGTTLLCVLVGVVGIGGGSWYTTNKLFDTLIKEVRKTTSAAQSVLRQVKGFATKEELSIRLKNTSDSVREDISNNFSKKIEDVNERLLLLSTELMDVHVHIEQQLFDLEDSTKSFVNNKVIKTEKEIKKQLGEMYDRVDVLYKDLDKLSSTIDTAKETFLGKLIIK